MLNAIRVLSVIAVCHVAAGAQAALLTHKEICQQMSNAVVQIDAGGSSHGTGFIVSADGWILTAAHIILDESTNPLKAYSAIGVTFPDGSTKLADLVSPVEPNMVARDYALLKITGTNLPHLDLGDKSDDVIIGGDLTIIGYPFSAVAFHGTGPSVKDKFCLSATVAYSGQTTEAISGATPKGPTTVSVGVDVIYFQGPSVKGLSGSPIISRDTGHVVAILTSKLTGISAALDKDRKSFIDVRSVGGMSLGGGNVGGTLISVIDTLDQQLANGLGAGTGIEDAKAAMRHILRQRHASQK